ncbi:hypothetical protein QE152_g32541 [Popillia japonica]|uniref:Metallothionein n=1 Tax=Popillia japonica TaxID=7064 RepID=A0AAW1IYT4_POPJA
MSSGAGKAVSCTKNLDGSCVKISVYELNTPEGKKECECICTCKGSNCDTCVCRCNCTLEAARKVQTAEGVKYSCECTCDC